MKIKLIIGTVGLVASVLVASNSNAKDFGAEIIDFKEITKRKNHLSQAALKESLGREEYQAAVTANKRGDKRAAIAKLKRAILYFQKEKDEGNYIVANLALSQIYMDIGLLNEAETILTRISLSIERPELLAIAKGLLGNVYLRYENYDRAIEQYQESLKIQEIPATLIRLSQAQKRSADRKRKNVESSTGESQRARRKTEIDRELERGYEAAVKATLISQSSEDKINSKLNLLKYYKNFLESQQLKKYKVEIEEEIKLLPDRSLKADALIRLADLLNADRALERLKESQEIAETIGDPRSLAIALEKMGKIYFDLKDYDRAMEFSDRAIGVDNEFPQPERSFYRIWQLAKIKLARGDKEDAIESYELAFKQLQSERGEFAFNNFLFTLQEDARLFLRNYISLLLESNRAEEAIEVLPTLKLAEFQDYFNDPCFDLTINPQQQTDPSTATIHTFLSPERLYLILEYQNKYTLRSVKISKEELEEKIAAYRQVVVLGSATKFISPSKELNEIIIEPISESIPEGVKKLIIVRDGAIKSIPIETLIDRNNKYLIKKYEIVYGPGLPGSLKVNNKGEKIIFGLTKSRIIRLPLDYIIAEAEAIASATSGRTYIDREFNEEKLALVLSDNKKIALLHIATHGSFSGDAENSYLETYDGKLSLLEFKQLLLNAQPIALLTLSGCETAAGSEVATLGFAGVAVRARIENVIGALWSIPDNLTALFMEEFYRNRASGMSPAAAKRAAQIAIVEAGESPRSWAGIILIEN